jgi:hypothetical protein
VFASTVTQSKRAIDHLAFFKPHLLPHKIGAAVDEFERSILFYADPCSHRRPVFGVLRFRSRLRLKSLLNGGYCISYVPSVVLGCV